MNKKQSLTCQRWCHGPVFFLHQFMRFVLLLLLHHSGKLAIPYDHLFLFLQIMHLVLFNFLKLQGKLIISVDTRIVFWWARDGNKRLPFLRIADLPFVPNIFVAIYFWPIFDCQFLKVVLLMLQQCRNDCVVIGGRWTSCEI